jgi:hypothetical protein
MPAKISKKRKSKSVESSNTPKTNVFSSSFKRSSFSKNQLIIFALVFALIGGYILWKSFAAAPLVASMEAEQMSLPAGASIITDTSASAGKAIQLKSNGAATGSVNFPSSVTSLSIIARGAQCQGAPTMNISLDGTAILTAVAISSTSWTSYSATPANAIASGSHNLSISFTNAYSKTKGNNQCSRAVYLDDSSFYGPTPVTPAPTVVLSATPSSVTAGTASTLTWASTNTTSCTASGAWSGTQPTSGSVSTGALNQNSVYTITCAGSGGSASASTVVSVSTVQTSCTSSTTAWQNASFAQQAGTFSASFYATPSAQANDNVTGFSSAAAADYTNLAVAVRFNTNSTIDARNGGAYAAVNTVNYTAGMSYYFRFSINVAAHTYDAYVTPAGGTEVQIASSYAFRTEQAGITSLSNFGMVAATGTQNVCGPMANGTAISFTANQPPPNGTLLFDGVWPSSGSPNLSIWSGPGTATNGSTVIGMRDPLGSAENVGYFKVARNNTNPCCTYAGRADFESPELMSPTLNNDVYVSIPVYVPISNIAEMYKQAHNGFMIAENYGPPYGGSPAAGSVDATAVSSTAFHYDFTWNDFGAYDPASCEYGNNGSPEMQWNSPLITTNAWHTIIQHIHWSSTTSGFEEIWYDGVPQQFHASSRSGCPGAPPQTGTGGANTRIYFPNFVSGNNAGSPNFIDVNLYGNTSTDGAIFTAYHGETRIGTTLSIVQPRTYPTGP